MYQEIYSFNPSEPSEHEEKSIYFDPDQQFTQLANEFNIRYPSDFDHSPQDVFDSTTTNQDILHTNDDEELHFDAFRGINGGHELVTGFSHEASLYDTIMQENSESSPLVAKTTIHTLPPLNATPIKVAPLQHHPTANHHTYLLACKKPLKGSSRPFRERAPWTPEEDNLLRLAVQLYGDKTEKWSKIAACVPGRTNKNCRKRWFHSLDPSLRKGAWTDEEDQLLREGLSKYPKQWSKIADMLEGRTDDQCAKRWRESLDPSIDRSDWTAEEDKKLAEKYEEYGSQWQKIACFFEGRPGLHCRNRWRKLQRMIQIKKDRQSNTSFVNTLLKSNVQSTTYKQDIPFSLNPVSNPIQMTESSNSGTNSKETSNESIPPVNHDVLIQYTAEPNEITDEFKDGLTPYGCDMPGCLAVFSSSSRLFNHMKKSHVNVQSIDKPYRCAIKDCPKKYKNINGLQYHLKDSKGTTGYGHSSLLEDKPFSCSVPDCNKAYKTVNGLRYHAQHGHTKAQQEPHIIPFSQTQE